MDGTMQRRMVDIAPRSDSLSGEILPPGSGVPAAIAPEPIAGSRGPISRLAGTIHTCLLRSRNVEVQPGADVIEITRSWDVRLDHRPYA